MLDGDDGAAWEDEAAGVDVEGEEEAGPDLLPQPGKPTLRSRLDILVA